MDGGCSSSGIGSSEPFPVVFRRFAPEAFHASNALTLFRNSAAFKGLNLESETNGGNTAYFVSSEEIPKVEQAILGWTQERMKRMAATDAGKALQNQPNPKKPRRIQPERLESLEVPGVLDLMPRKHLEHGVIQFMHPQQQQRGIVQPATIGDLQQLAASLVAVVQESTARADESAARLDESVARAVACTARLDESVARADESATRLDESVARAVACARALDAAYNSDGADRKEQILRLEGEAANAEISRVEASASASASADRIKRLHELQEMSRGLAAIASGKAPRGLPLHADNAVEGLSAADRSLKEKEYAESCKEYQELWQEGQALGLDADDLDNGKLVIDSSDRDSESGEDEADEEDDEFFDAGEEGERDAQQQQQQQQKGWRVMLQELASVDADDLVEDRAAFEELQAANEKRLKAYRMKQELVEDEEDVDGDEDDEDDEDYMI